MESETNHTVPPYPVSLELTPTTRFERVQLLLRVLVLVAIGIGQHALGGFFGLLYFFLPVVAAILISRRGGEGYLARDAGWITGVLEWVAGLYAYLAFVTDRFPLDASSRLVRLRISASGFPSVGTAVLRLLKSLPHAFVLFLLGFVSAIVWLIAFVLILFTEKYPDSLRAFQHGLVAWSTRLFAYHASLVEPYPPFSLSTGADAGQSGADPDSSDSDSGGNLPEA